MTLAYNKILGKRQLKSLHPGLRIDPECIPPLDPRLPQHNGMTYFKLKAEEAKYDKEIEGLCLEDEIAKLRALERKIRMPWEAAVTELKIMELRERVLDIHREIEARDRENWDTILKEIKHIKFEISIYTRMLERAEGFHKKIKDKEKAEGMNNRLACVIHALNHAQTIEKFHKRKGDFEIEEGWDDSGNAEG